MAARLGEAGVRALLEGHAHHLIGVHCNHIDAIAYEEAATCEYPLDTSLYQLIRVLGQ